MSETPVIRQEPLGPLPSSNSWTIGRVLWPTLLVGGILFLLAAFFLPVHRSAREPARRTQCSNNLRNIGQALHNYHEDYKAFPPAYSSDAYGRPLHSWRTLLLPYVDQLPLYESIDLSKPWDDPANAKAFGTSVHIYQCPSHQRQEGSTNHTTYLACVGVTGCLHPTRARASSEITDGLSDTLMLIEVPTDQSVHWMSPHDADEALLLAIRPESKLAHPGGMNVALCDGRILFLSGALEPATRRALFSIAAGDKVDDF
jgi:prepilin-type processing-associated H-X9-DG protein